MATSVSYIFSTLEKFSDDSKVTLSQWLRKFDRCCIVAKKADGAEGNVKGQLLLLYVEGRARAILDDYEDSLGGVPQTYDALAEKLREHFESALTREQAMKSFEGRVQGLSESEEEFMLELAKLYSLANPTHAANIKLAAVKRKFMNGISAELRRNVFIFCNNPFAAGVTRENLLAHCRNARMHLSTASSSGNDCAAAVTAMDGANGGLIAAVNELTLQVKSHVEATEKRFEEVGEAISVMSSSRGGNRSGFRGAFRGGYRGSRGFQRGGDSRGFQRSTNNRGNRVNNASDSNRDSNRGRGQIICHACHGPNHYARNCLQQGN